MSPAQGSHLRFVRKMTVANGGEATVHSHELARAGARTRAQGSDPQVQAPPHTSKLRGSLGLRQEACSHCPHDLLPGGEGRTSSGLRCSRSRRSSSGRKSCGRRSRDVSNPQCGPRGGVERRQEPDIRAGDSPHSGLKVPFSHPLSNPSLPHPGHSHLRQQCSVTWLWRGSCPHSAVTSLPAIFTDVPPSQNSVCVCARVHTPLSPHSLGWVHTHGRDHKSRRSGALQSLCAQ